MATRAADCAGAPRGQNPSGGGGGRTEFTLQAIDVSFDAIPDPKEREYFQLADDVRAFRPSLWTG